MRTLVITQSMTPVLNLQRENFGATPESHESENKEDHLFDDEDDDDKV